MESLYLLEARIFIAIVLGALVTPVIALLFNWVIAPFIKEKEIIKSRNAGHIVEAKLVKRAQQDYPGDIQASRIVYGTYEYIYNGKVYKYNARHVDDVPDRKTLYFKKNPKKAKIYEDFGTVESKLPIFILASIIAFIYGLFTL